MGEIQEILDSKIKPKEKVCLVKEKIRDNRKLVDELMYIFENGSDIEKGTCADIMKHITKDNPEVLVPYVDELIDYINYRASRVKWGVPEAIGNIAREFPSIVEKAVPPLLVNTEDKSTVVRWCAAFALAEIAKNNQKLREELVPKIEIIVEKEQNNGVKNVYLKALKVIRRLKT
ncbi:MAG: HEAT repeat domain-containing protein [Candidatus Ranarchaeia archaeon]